MPASTWQYVRGGAGVLLATQTLTRTELILLGVLGLLALLKLGASRKQQPLRWVLPGALLVLRYGAGIIALDGLLNHHTIVVPRYYLPLHLVLLLGLVAVGERGQSAVVQVAVIAGVMLLFAKVHVQQLTALREAKQMYREAGTYLAQHYQPNTVELVVVPNGPTTLGIAYYCPADFLVRTEPIGQICSEYTKPGVVVAEQNLGLSIEAQAQPCGTPPAAARRKHFAFIDIVNAR